MTPQGEKRGKGATTHYKYFIYYENASHLSHISCFEHFYKTTDLSINNRQNKVCNMARFSSPSQISLLPLTFFLIITGSVVSGCSEDETQQAEAPIRAVKTIKVSERATNQVRRISGIIEAETITDLSFEISGQIVKLSVDIGDRVTKGDILGELETEPYQLKVDTARAELAKAQAALNDAQQKFNQQNTLIKKGFTTKTNFDTSKANLQTSENQVKIARTQLSIAERNVRKTKLIAPFSGQIATRYVNVFTEVGAGQKIIELHNEGNHQVEVSIPENLLRQIKTGDQVEVHFPTLNQLSTTGKIEEISSRTRTANAFPVKISLDKQFPEIRPGITAEVTFRYSTNATGSAFILPITALSPDVTASKADIFIFDPKTQRVRKKTIQVVNILNNDLEVAGDIKQGDIVVIAGISFLSDGMKVKLLDEGK